jgi:hypothetical protein
MRLSHYLASKGLFTQLPYESALIKPEQELWRAVIDNAVRDLASNNAEDKEEALFWFLNRGEDFQFVCDSAGLSSDYVAKIFDDKLYHLANVNVDVNPLKK